MQRHSPDRPHNIKPLKRGKACLTCRFLKIKCDGERPVCGPCIRHPKDDPCEYADGPGRSRTRLLEETISRLEARIRELEHPDMSTPPVTLHDPYTPYTQPLHLSTPPVASPDRLAYSPSSPYSVTSTLSTRSSPPSGSTSSSSISPLADVKLLQPEAAEELSLATMRNLMDRFFMHATEFGFFLNISRIYEGTFPPFVGNFSPPSAALLRVIYLWGAHLTPSLYPPAREHEFMLRALAETATNLSSSEHPQKVLQTMQAEVLLAYYFYRIGKSLEAKLHANNAASLALGAGLHKLRSPIDPEASPIAFMSNGPIYIPEPRDAVEEGERINGFWAVLMLSKNLNVAFAHAPGNVCGIFETPGLRIDTPWPLDMESYQDGYMPPPTSSTIHNFLSGIKPEYEDYESSFYTMTVKASILFHRATYLAGQYSPGLQPSQIQTFNSAFSYLDSIIESLRAHLPRLEELDVDPSTGLSTRTRTACLAQTLTYAAIIKLHGIFAFTYADGDTVSAASRDRCISAAKGILRVGDFVLNATNGKDIGCVNPIIGTLWVTACQIFISELHRVRARNHDPWTHPVNPPSPAMTAKTEEELMSSIHRCLLMLGYFAAESLMIRYQLTRLQEVYAAPSTAFQ